MGEVKTIGLDLAKSVFYVHGVDSHEDSVEEAYEIKCLPTNC